MKFRNPETGEVFNNLQQALEAFCSNYDSFCQGCPIDKVNDARSCQAWIQEHPHEAARLMGFEVVEENSNKLKETLINGNKEEANMDKPRICEVLGVEVGEHFKIEGYKGEYHINYCGVLKWGGQTSDDAIYEAINHPDRIIRKPRFTQQEVEFARLFNAACKNVVWIQRNDEKTLVWVVEYSNEEYRLPFRLFPSIQPGQSYTLDEIIGGAE